MHAFARPKEESVLSGGRKPPVPPSAAFSFKNEGSVNPNAPNPPTCSRSRRVRPSQSVVGEPRMRSTRFSRRERERQDHTRVPARAGESPARGLLLLHKRDRDVPHHFLRQHV